MSSYKNAFKQFRLQTGSTEELNREFDLVKSAFATIKTIVGPRGEQGPQGDPGTNGTNGAPGTNAVNVHGRCYKTLDTDNTVLMPASADCNVDAGELFVNFATTNCSLRIFITDCTISGSGILTFDVNGTTLITGITTGASGAFSGSASLSLSAGDPFQLVASTDSGTVSPNDFSWSLFLY